ncbi:radical SAM protein [Saccharopolyspora hattusasensis]|uniref:radical SAM protein n=1 Tax=Saccharopolyspora hattusasensis TaxID=1128679 RepID=UPI003D99D589
MPDGIFGYSCLGISVTMTCPLKCAHCITKSTPHVRDDMSVDEALKYLYDAQGAVDHVSFTGGEPFLKPARLRTLVREAKDAGYVVSVMTSGFWGRDKRQATRQLAELQELGLDMLGVSLDRYHLEFIDEGRCVNIAEACDALGIHVAVRVITTPSDNYGDHVRTLLSHTGAEVHVNFLVKLGRAEEFAEEDFKFSSRPPRETCETVTAADVVPGGVVYACCGPGLYMHEANPLILGNAQEESLGLILERGLTNPFMKVINTRGPVGLLEDLQENGFGHLVKLRERYTDACQLCLDICNSSEAVEALRRIYARPDIRRDQNAMQFLKMVRESQAVRRIRRPMDRPHA